MAGWGIQDGELVTSLQWFYKQYIDYATCRVMLSRQSIKLLSADKFCSVEVQSKINYVCLSI